MSVLLPVVCESLPECCAGSVPFYGQGKTYLSAQTGMILDCPPGFNCDAGAYPVTIIVPANTIPFTPPTGPGPLRFTCCDGFEVVRSLPANYTQAQFDTIAQSIVDVAAQHLLLCKAAAYNADNSRKPAKFRFSTSALPGACVGEETIMELTTTGGTSPIVFTLNGGTLPAGMSLSPDGFLSGTPTTSAFYGLSIRATDAEGRTAVGVFTVTIAQITTATSLPDGATGSPYSQSLAETGAVLPVTWTVIAGALPDGLNLSTAGLISGIPTLNGDFSFTAQMTDAVGATCTKPFSLTITAGCGSIDWCNGPYLSPCRLRVKNFNLADWTVPINAGYLDSWDGGFTVPFPQFANPCFVYGWLGEFSTSQVTIRWNGSTNWIMGIILPVPAGFTYFATGPASSPIGIFVIDGGPASGGPASFEVEAFIP